MVSFRLLVKVEQKIQFDRADCDDRVRLFLSWPFYCVLYVGKRIDIEYFKLEFDREIAAT